LVRASLVKRRAVALIDEARCIGCTRCIRACPVEAIAGAQGFMHTVIAAYCVGCELCLPPCPVDCIAMVPPPAGHSWSEADARAAKLRHRQRKMRLAREQAGPRPQGSERRRAVIEAALKRVAARRARAA
jgi:electron transport complex protein RnfB